MGQAATPKTYPDPPANIAAYVDALGREDAVRFLLTFGGSELYIPVTPRETSQIAMHFGITKARALAAIRDDLPVRVPLGSRWIAQVLKVDGYSANRIARVLHVTDATVRKWLKAANARGAKA